MWWTLQRNASLVGDGDHNILTNNPFQDSDQGIETTTCNHVSIGIMTTAANTPKTMESAKHYRCDSAQIWNAATIEGLLSTEEQSKIMWIATMHSDLVGL